MTIRQNVDDLRYYGEKILIHFEKTFSGSARYAGAVYTNAEANLSAYETIIFFFDDPLMHIGDQMYFKPLIRKLHQAGREVQAAPTEGLRFFFEPYLGPAGPARIPLFVSRFEVLPALRRRFGSAIRYFLYNTSAMSIDRPISNFIVDAFCEHFRLAGLDRSIAASDYVDFPLPRDDRFGLRRLGRIAVFNNYVDSGKFRIGRKARAALLSRLAEARTEDCRVIHLGGQGDKVRDKTDYSSIVDLDLRGMTAIRDLFSILSADNVLRVYCYDTVLLHIANFFDKSIYIYCKKYFRRGEQEQKRKAFVSLYEKDLSHIEILGPR